MKSLLIGIGLVGLFLNQTNSFFSTHFVGLQKNEIKRIMSDEYSQLKLNTSNVNRAYNYLKYEDFVNEITVLFFLSDNDECKRIRLMSDYSNLSDVLNLLNSYYEIIGKNKWKYSVGKKNYAVNLDEGDWFFTVTIKNKDDK
jgi:hypothetical protein